MTRNLPLITIATVTYNAAATLERTLQSVERQRYPRIEHLIIDGMSSDATLSLVRQYVERNVQTQHTIRILSEPDKGLYDAMNKALALCEGDYIVFLNAGDKLHAEDTLEQMVEKIEWEPRGVNPAVVYGETDLVDDEGTFLRHRRLETPEVLTSRSFLQGMLVCHQSFYVRTDLARQLKYNTRYRYSADFDWCIRVMKRAEQRRMRMVNTHLILTDYLSEGLTTQNHRKSLWERFHVMRHHYGLLRTVCVHAWFVLRSVWKR